MHLHLENIQKKYVSQELQAKENKKGMWQGKFEYPWDYRKKN